MFPRALIAALLAAGLLAAQDSSPAPAAPGPVAREIPAGNVQVTTGTRIPLGLINSISTKHSAEGDRVYLETVFPILVNGRIVVPVGSYVAGTVTHIKKPGRVKGRGEMYIRFDSLTLPNGVTRDFRARMGAMDGNTSSELDSAEGTVKSDGNKLGDLSTVGQATAAGASVGAIAGSAAGRPGLGIGVGAAAGAAAGLIGVLATRGPDAVLARGTTVEMVLDRPLAYSDAELSFGEYQPPRAIPASAPAQTTEKGNRTIPMSGRRWPN